MGTQTKNGSWLPFVPGAGANAQLVLNAETGGTLDFFLCAGWHCGEQLKTGQIFCQREAHYLPSLQLHTAVHTIPRELDYLPGAGWKTDILADRAGKHYMEAVFQIRRDGGLQIFVNAVNKSKLPARWVLNLFSGRNLPGSETPLPAGFRITDTFGMISVPPFRGGEHPDGLLAAWGTQRDLKKYPEGLTPSFAEITLPPQSNKTGYIFLGAKSAGAEKTIVFPKPEIREKAFSHLAAQLNITRAYPVFSRGNTVPQAAFTPCAHMEWPFIWDAGFIACALAISNPELAQECIAQYLPGMPDSLWKCAMGAAVPTQIMAALELYQQTGNMKVWQKLYPGLRSLWRKAAGLEVWDALDEKILDSDGDGLITAPGGGSGLDDAPSQVWCRGYGVDWARQENYWSRPLEVNPSGGIIPCESVNLTAFTILGAKILHMFQQEEEYGAYIAKAEKALFDKCWNENTGHFHWVTGDEHSRIPYYDISGLTPLFSGTWQDDTHYERMLKELFTKYMTPKGLTTVWPEADFYRTGYWCGAIWIPLHWMFWKSLVGQGRFDEAEMTAERMINTWLGAYRKFPVNYEKFDLATGDGSGSMEFGGLGAVLLNLYAGSRSGIPYRGLGWNTLPEKWQVAKNRKSARITLHSVTDTGARVMLKPDTAYRMNVNGEICSAVSNRYGWLNIKFPAGKAEILIEERRH